MGKKTTYRYLVSNLLLLVCMFLLSFLLLNILSLMAWKMDGNVKFVSGGLIAIYIMVNVFGGFMAGKIFGRQKFLWGMVLGILFFSILLLSGFFMWGIKALDSGRVFSGLMICMISGMFGGMISPGRKSDK